MDSTRIAQLLVALTAGEVVLTVLYAVQTLLGAGLWLVLGMLALLALSLSVLSLGVWRRTRWRRYVYREECPPERSPNVPASR